MKNTVQEIIKCLEEFAPLYYQESYDNSGLLLGDRKEEVRGVLCCLDLTEEVLDEALSLNCNLVIAHHPIIFSGIKKLTGANYVERLVIKAIKHGISVYASHTNLDNVLHGVNKKIAERLGIEKYSILSPKPNSLRKLVTFVPNSEAEKVRNALFDAGAGQIGNYSECSFNLLGQGTFKAGSEAKPYVGEIAKRHTEEETRLELVYETHKESVILSALKAAHPYEEVAYDCYSLHNKNGEIGSGMIGEFPEALTEIELLIKLKESFNCGIIKHTKLRNQKIKRLAWCGGSGSFLLQEAIGTGAEAYISADFKYHEFFDAENKIVIFDIGHYESEQFTPEIFYQVITNKFTTFASHLSKVNTNPVKYF